MNRPPALVCYICGRQFGTKSLAFHLKACEKKWENEENLKPPKDRRPCPRPPQALGSILEKGQVTKQDIHNFNVKSFDSYVEEALVECEYCGRRFNPKSLVPHQKACKTSPMIRKPPQNKGPLGKYEQGPIESKGYNPTKFEKEAYDAPNTGNLAPCRRCGRTFAADRVGKHERVCKADPVDKKPPPAKVEKKVEIPRNKPNFGKEKKAKWKVQHQQFQNALKVMRQMKAIQAKGGKLSDLPPPPPSNYDHYVECRHCGRKYAADVAERHIPKCANIINKPGGIKPSRIQQKYIAGTGAGKPVSNSYVQPKSTSSVNSKPNFGTKSTIADKAKVESSPFGSKAGSSGVGGSSYGVGGSSYGVGGSSYGVGGSSYGVGGSSYGVGGSSMKPNFKSNSRTNANKYW